jgi:hypothetical protein
MIALVCSVRFEPSAAMSICIQWFPKQNHLTTTHSLCRHLYSENVYICVTNFEPNTTLGSATIFWFNPATVLTLSMNLQFCRPYLTRVQLGNPPKNFTVLIDTGSSIPWVSCQTPGGPNGSVSQFDPQTILPLKTKCSL